ncbi:MAG: hypothetical protein AAB439_02495 [Patescibacteria group bacterium]
MFLKTLASVFVFIFVFSVSTGAQASHSWGNYHWARTVNPFTLKLGDNVTSAWDAYLAEASSDWSASSVLDTTVVTGLTNAKNCKAVTGRVEVCNSKYGNNGWLGIASISINSAKHITKGVAKMNDTYFNTASYNTPAWRHLVMCQEIAHVFGLDHQDETFDNANVGSCMDYTNDPDGGAGGASASDPSNEHPNAHDFAQLETIYAHLDSGTTIGQTLIGKEFGKLVASLKGVEAHEEYGVPVGFEPSGRANTFKKDFEDGSSEITHVFWLPE